MHIALIIQFINRIEGLLLQAKGRGLLHIIARILPLGERLGRQGILMGIKGGEHAGKGILIRSHFRVSRQFQCSGRHLCGNIADAPQTARVAPPPQRFRQGRDRRLGHTVQQVIRLGIKQDRAAYAVRPEVVMRHPPQARFNSAQDDRHRLLEMLADQVAINRDRPVRAPRVLSTGGEIITFAAASRGRPIGDHGVDAASAHTPEQGRLA